MMKAIYEEASRKLLRMGIISVAFLFLITGLALLTRFTVLTVIAIVAGSLTAVFDFTQFAKFMKRAKECEDAFKNN